MRPVYANDGFNTVNFYRVLTWADVSSYWEEIGEFIKTYKNAIISFNITVSKAIQIEALIDGRKCLTVKELKERIHEFSKLTVDGPTRVIALGEDCEDEKLMGEEDSVFEWVFFLATKKD